MSLVSPNSLSSVQLSTFPFLPVYPLSEVFQTSFAAVLFLVPFVTQSSLLSFALLSPVPADVDEYLHYPLVLNLVI